MSEILLSFFAVIGVTFLVMMLMDFLFYRKANSDSVLLLDFREKSEEEMVEVFEMISTVRSRRSGKGAISKVIVILKKNGGISKDRVYQYINAFSLNGAVFTDDSWKDRF